MVVTYDFGCSNMVVVVSCRHMMVNNSTTVPDSCATLSATNIYLL